MGVHTKHAQKTGISGSGYDIQYGGDRTVFYGDTCNLTVRVNVLLKRKHGSIRAHSSLTQHSRHRTLDHLSSPSLVEVLHKKD